MGLSDHIEGMAPAVFGKWHLNEPRNGPNRLLPKERVAGLSCRDTEIVMAAHSLFRFVWDMGSGYA